MTKLEFRRYKKRLDSRIFSTNTFSKKIPREWRKVWKFFFTIAIYEGKSMSQARHSADIGMYSYTSIRSDRKRYFKEVVANFKELRNK